MAAWPRTIRPQQASDFILPPPLVSRSQGGKVNTRATGQLGRRWSETYLVRMQDVSAKAFLATIRNYWRKGTSFTIVHPDYETPNGAGGGTPLVAGASQTGSLIVIDGATTATAGWLKVGDIFTIAGVPYALDVTADVSTNASGTATIAINPPILSAPANNASLVISGVSMTCVIFEEPEMPTSGPDGFGFVRVTFMETL